MVTWHVEFSVYIAHQDPARSGFLSGQGAEAVKGLCLFHRWRGCQLHLNGPQLPFGLDDEINLKASLGPPIKDGRSLP